MNMIATPPSNMGKKWNEEEEVTLLDELERNLDMNQIAQNHKRTVGGISFRLEDIAYKMYSKEVPMEEIQLKTRLSEERIAETIQKRQQARQQAPKQQAPKQQQQEQKQGSKEKTSQSQPDNEIAELKNVIVQMKSEISELKNSVKELIEMMKAVYEFEDA